MREMSSAAVGASTQGLKLLTFGMLQEICGNVRYATFRARPKGGANTRYRFQILGGPETTCPGHRGFNSARLSFAETRSGRTPGAQYHENPLYRLPLLVSGATMLASTAVGAARGALDTYLEMTSSRRTRGALAGGGLAMAEFATVQLRFAEASAAIETAEMILLTDLRNATQKLYAGEEITVADRIRCRRNQAYATKLAVEAVEAL